MGGGDTCFSSRQVDYSFLTNLMTGWGEVGEWWWWWAHVDPGDYSFLTNVMNGCSLRFKPHSPDCYSPTSFRSDHHVVLCGIGKIAR